VYFRDFSLTVRVDPAFDEAWVQVEPDSSAHACDGPCEIVQASSGGPNWQSLNHVDRFGRVSLLYRGYRGRVGTTLLEGWRAKPAIALRSQALKLVVSAPYFWEEFPKAVEVDRQTLVWRFFPQQAASEFELQGGEQKTHRLGFLFSPRDLRAGLGAVRQGLRDRNHPSVHEACLPGLPAVHGGDREILQRIDRLLAQFVHGERGLLARREEVDDYGWRHFGDLHADHEELHYDGPRPLISHYNNQFDPLLGFLLQWLRTKDDQWMELAAPLAQHVIDIDIYHTERDRPAYNGGLFWFTDHYLHAHTSTHRTFSRHNRRGQRGYGGGPGAEHNFTTGLLLYHRLTQDDQAAEAVLGLARWVLAMDDGRQTCWSALEDGPTGLATLGGIGRGAGNSINALVDAWLLTGDGAWLEAAEHLVRRCIHPQTDWDSLGLLDAERKWSYTIFGMSLVKFLEARQAAGLFDAAYAYAYESLRSLGAWMAVHERPYFAQREALEFPTETWPAQDLRKANLLRLAAACAEEPERSRMLARGDALADSAWSDLLACPKPTTTRAMAIVMVEGLRDAQLRVMRPAPFPPPAQKPPCPPTPPAPFVPLKQRIAAQLRSPRGVAKLATRAVDPRNWLRLICLPR
jgi:hypothetical protein